MKRCFKIIFLVFTLSILSLILNNCANAATVTFNGPSEVTVGETITVTANINAAQWNLSISKDGTVLNSSNELVNAEANLTKSFSATYTPTSAGTVTFTLSGDYTDIDLTNKEISTTKTVTVKEKEQEQVPTTPEEPKTPSEGGNTDAGTDVTPQPETPVAPTVTEPTFTEVNETVYVKSQVNVRKSYSTSSERLGVLQEGEELTRTGIGSNGWSRVKYNGQTAYISSSYLTNTKPQEEEKSNNANLKSLTVEGQELMPQFSSETTSYIMQVNSDVTKLDIKAEAEDEKASVSIKGNTELKDGENTVTISVSAEDGTIKIYEITVTRSEKIALGLKSLKITDTDIAKMFRTDIYEYEIDIKDVAKLSIEAIANDEKAIVEILGNEDLQEGENLITIMVSSEDGEEKVTYQIKANKVIAKVDVTQKEEVDTKIYFYIAIAAILIIALIIVIVYTILNRKNEEFIFNDKYEGFPEELPEKSDEISYNEDIGQQETEKSNTNYFLDSEENSDEDENPRPRRGKHF